MKQQDPGISLTGTIWRIAFCAFIFAFGLVASRLVLNAVGVTAPRIPQQADESTAVYYLLTGSVLLFLGLFPLIRNINGGLLVRLPIVFLFFFVCFGISTSLESSIYSSIGGYDLMALILILPILLFSIASTALTKFRETDKGLRQRYYEFFKSRTPGEWTWRILLAALSFPFVYLAFGVVVSPLVTDYYQDVNYGLVIPDIGTILAVQLIRSLLFLPVTLPVLIAWSGKKGHLVMALGLAHFVMVFSYDIVLAYQLPIGLVLTHANEILLDSLVYSWIFVTLIYVENLKNS